MTTKPEVRIENWSVDGAGSLYTPPEHMALTLVGRVYGHPHRTDGKLTRTSLIKGKVEGFPWKVETQNTIYILGEVHPEYLRWCEDNGHHIPTDEEPIKWLN